VFQPGSQRGKVRPITRPVGFEGEKGIRAQWREGFGGVTWWGGTGKILAGKVKDTGHRPE